MLCWNVRPEYPGRKTLCLNAGVLKYCEVFVLPAHALISSRGSSIHQIGREVTAHQHTLRIL